MNLLLLLAWLVDSEAKQPQDPQAIQREQNDETNASQRADYARINAKFPGWCEGMSHSEAMDWEDVWDRG